MHLGQLGCISQKQQPQPSFMVISAVAMLLSLLAAALEEEEEEEDAEMEELLWEGLFLEELFCAVQDGFQTCGSPAPYTPNSRSPTPNATPHSGRPFHGRGPTSAEGTPGRKRPQPISVRAALPSRAEWSRTESNRTERSRAAPSRAEPSRALPALRVPRRRVVMFCLLLALGVLVLGLAGAMEIQVPDEPVVARYGQDATLRCSFSPEANFSLEDLSLIWQLTDTKRLVHSFSGGRDQLTDQGGGFANRTALFYDQLSQGNVSLLLRRVEIADEGSFTCFVRVRDYNSAAVTLQVAAPYSKPTLNLEPNKDLKPGDPAAVTCQSSYGYPEASVLWQDSHGANITENVTTSQVANEEGLFDVYSVLHVLVEPSSTYSCLVRNPVLQQETHASVTITGQHLAFPAAALWVTVGLAICIVVLLAVLAYICQKKIRQSCEEEENAGTEEQDTEGEEQKTALQPLKSTEDKADNEQEID
ncbi:CD276 antigen [Cyrtonyx montezumae]|uniref:CD276 antigen n=1 Tax=Cyrtonyx montezumae TaxID=9017 RepID=UPI0032DBB46F